MENSYVPEIYVGENGNWFINGVDTGTKAQGDPGKDGLTPNIGADGFWYIGETNTGVRASGDDGISPHIGTDGFWYSGERNTLVKAQGEKGDTGAPGIQGSKGDKGDNGADGAQGFPGEKGDPGAKGEQGIQGIAGATGPQGKQGIQGPQGIQGVKGDKGEPGPENIANDLTTSAAGFALDARQGKVLKDSVDSVNSKLSEIDAAVKRLDSYFDTGSAKAVRSLNTSNAIQFRWMDNKLQVFVDSNYLGTIQRI